MTEERRRILDMLSAGKVTVEEAERLLEALQGLGLRHVYPLRSGIEEAKHLEALQGTRKEESLSESENDARDRDGKTSLHDDTFAVGDNPSLVVRGFNGPIRVHTGEPGSIRVRARLKKPHEIKYNATQEGDRIAVEAKPDRQTRHSGANIEVTVPVTTSVDLATSNGPVALQGTESSGTVQTKNGPIRVENFKGDLNAATKNAPIAVKKLSGSAELSTSDGPVSIEDAHGRFNVRTKNAPIAVKTFSGSAELSTSNGRVSIEGAHGRFNVQTTNGAIKFQGSIESTNRLSTTNGSIKVALDADPNLALTAATTNGRVRCEVPGFVASVEKRHELKGTVGAGEAELIAKSTNGSITIQ